ncbi:hypothetical protein JW979_03700 [bacterium]|nr:hypothetical protein [candidate division CSSED10-310 bacterium]
MKLTIISFFLIIMTVFAYAIDLPPAPSGYSWKVILNDKSALLIPDGWFFKHETKAGTEAFFVTKEDINLNGVFKTGLTLNILKNIDAKSSMPPSVYAMKLMSEICSSNTVIKSSSGDNGPFKTFLFQVNSKNDNETLIIHHVLAANDATGTLWLYIFEAPEEQWKEAWKTGEVMLNILALETEI